MPPFAYLVLDLFSCWLRIDKQSLIAWSIIFFCIAMCNLLQIIVWNLLNDQANQTLNEIENIISKLEIYFYRLVLVFICKECLRMTSHS